MVFISEHSTFLYWVPNRTIVIMHSRTQNAEPRESRTQEDDSLTHHSSSCLLFLLFTPPSQHSFTTDYSFVSYCKIEIFEMTIRKGVRDAASRVRGSIKRLRVRTPIDEVPSLKDFIQKKSVIHQYRSFLRAVGSIGDDTYRHQGLHEVRKEFDSLKFEEDKVVISMAVQEVRVSCAQPKNFISILIIQYFLIFHQYREDVD